MSNLKYKVGDRVRVWCWTAEGARNYEDGETPPKGTGYPFDGRDITLSFLLGNHPDFLQEKVFQLVEAEDFDSFPYAVTHPELCFWGFYEVAIIGLAGSAQIAGPTSQVTYCKECKTPSIYPVKNLECGGFICTSCKDSYGWKYSGQITALVGL